MLSGASGEGVHDYRKAGDVKLSKYFDRWIVGVGAVVSSEHDYLSRGGVFDLRWFSEDRNTTLAFSFGGAADVIDSTNGIAVDQRRNTVEFLVGVTQALSPTSIVQSNVTYSRGHGYFSDPYKTFDDRPDQRRITAWLTRYNEFFPRLDATLKVGYRYLDDSFGADSNMVEAAWVQALPTGFSLTPNSALPVAGRRVVLRQPAVAERLGRGSAVHRRHAAVGVRRDHRGTHGREDAAGRLERRPQVRVLPPAQFLEARRRRQPGAAAVLARAGSRPASPRRSDAELAGRCARAASSR